MDQQYKLMRILLTLLGEEETVKDHQKYELISKKGNAIWIREDLSKSTYTIKLNNG